MIEPTFEGLEAFFKEENYQVAIEEETEISPKQLVVALGKDPNNQDVILRLSLQHENSLHFLQFFIVLPYLVDEDAVLETGRLILSINASFDLAGFGLIEGSRILYFRYLHMFMKKSLSKEVLQATIASIELLIETFIPSITAVASGLKDIETLQKEAKEEARQLEFEIL